MSSLAFPVQPKLFVTLSSTHCASDRIGDLVNLYVGPQKIHQLLYTERTVMTALAEQRDVMLIYGL